MRRLVASLFVALALVAPAASFAADHAKPAPLALQGYCPVAYVAMGKAVKGDAHFSSTVDGHRYLFANADAKKMFDAEPAKYTVAYDGYCATAAAMGHKVKSSPRYFSVHGGRTFLFSTAEAKKAFDGMPDDVAKKADEAWPKVCTGACEMPAGHKM